MSGTNTSSYAYSAVDIGRAIRARRKKLGYTQKQIADFNQCSLRFVSELERGKSGAGIGAVMRIANSLGLDIAIIERGDGSSW